MTSDGPRGRDRPVPGPLYMTGEQKGQQPQMFRSLLPHTPSRPSSLRKSFPVEEDYSQDAQTVRYLASLREDKTQRPAGSRPPPPSKSSTLKRSETAVNVILQKEIAQHDRPTLSTSNSMPILSTADEPGQRTESIRRIRSPFIGRALVRPPIAVETERSSSASAVDPVIKKNASMPYIERGSRWMEKQETQSISAAMRNMDLEQDQKLHSAAQDEAAELVWKHQNPEAAFAQANAPFANPDITRDYKAHLRKGSYQRSHSQEYPLLVGKRCGSGVSVQLSPDETAIGIKHKQAQHKASSPCDVVSLPKTRKTSGKSYGGLAEAVKDDIKKAQRRISSGSRRILSSEKKKFMHPDDRIFEDLPEEVTPPRTYFAEIPNLPPPTQSAHVRKNPFARVRLQAERLERSRSEPIVSLPKYHSVEIQKNPPTQSRNAGYTSNEHLPLTPPTVDDECVSAEQTHDAALKDGKEIRGDDIRTATSKQRKEYSPKLPRPTVVSDKPGRPIVSFKEDWKPKEVVLEEVRAPAIGFGPTKSTSPFRTKDPCKTSTPPSSHHSTSNLSKLVVDEASTQPIPTINLPDEPSVPCIVLPEEPDLTYQSQVSLPAVPDISIDPPSISINAPESHCSHPPSRPEPARPLPHHAATSPLPKFTPHFTPSLHHSGALCARCGLPIAGRILSAAGERFHPSCFVCDACHTNLELVAFYPEPEDARTSRLIPSDSDSADYLEPTLRFYCHLDFHELFSPRCKSCKTPIEGEVIVACGAEWHVGHFFCAQCGDPFEQKTPFVEKDGYAWCVGCHTNRFSPKCRRCKKPVVETVVKALGHDWHAGCFVCEECTSEFDDGRYFLRDESQNPVCVRCEERRLKA